MLSKEAIRLHLREIRRKASWFQPDLETDLTLQCHKSKPKSNIVGKKEEKKQTEEIKI